MLAIMLILKTAVNILTKYPFSPSGMILFLLALPPLNVTNLIVAAALGRAGGHTRASKETTPLIIRRYKHCAV